MIEIIKIICMAAVGGLLLNGLAVWIGSNFLMKFLSDNLIVLLLALMAINTTTMSVVMTKLKEIQDRTQGGNFCKTVGEMKVSVYEQIWLIILTLLIQIVMGSSKAAAWPKEVAFLLTSVLAGIFVYAIYILYDTAKSIFVILTYEHK